MQNGVWKPVLYYIGIEGTNVVWYMTKAFRWKKCAAWICNRLYAYHHHPKLPSYTQPSYYNVVVREQCVIECQKYNEVKFLRKNTPKLVFKNMSHSHILFTMLIILNITINRLIASTTSKTSYMLDFNEVFWRPEKRGKNAENCGFWKFFCGALRCRWRPCRRGTLRTPISERGRVALRTRIICPPLSSTLGKKRDGNKNPQRKNYIIIGERTKYSWLHFQGVGPLQNSIKGALITMNNA